MGSHITLLSCKLAKILSLFLVYWYSLSKLIHHTKIKLSQSMTLFYCKVAKMSFPCIILRYAKTKMIEIAKIVLSQSMTLICCKLVEISNNVALHQDYCDKDSQACVEPKHHLDLRQAHKNVERLRNLVMRKHDIPPSSTVPICC